MDTAQISNTYLPGIGGDYDGDMVTIKGVFTNEANDELKEFMRSKQNYVSFGVSPTRASEGDAVQAMFALTRVLSDTKITKEISFK